jgi:hypothetical protein
MKYQDFKNYVLEKADGKNVHSLHGYLHEFKKNKIWEITWKHNIEHYRKYIKFAEQEIAFGEESMKKCNKIGRESLKAIRHLSKTSYRYDQIDMSEENKNE